MIEKSILDPFSKEPIEEVRLSNAPLARVIVQVRFPQLAALSSGNETARKYIARMSEAYPILQEGHNRSITISPEGVHEDKGSMLVWQLRSPDETWQISFSSTTFTLDTSAYVDRATFLKKFEENLAVFLEVAKPPSFERLGFRYINRVSDKQTIDRLKELVQKEILGGMGVLTSGAQLQQSICESIYQIEPKTQLQARWGLLPGSMVLDPSIPPVNTKSWWLDIDVSTTDKDKFSSADFVERVNELAIQGYRFFRWVVTDEFLELHGAKK